MRQSLFQPCVTVDDDGKVSIDWADSQVNTIDITNDAFTEFEDCELSERHAQILDEILGVGQKLTASEMLQRLARYLQRQYADA